MKLRGLRRAILLGLAAGLALFIPSGLQAIGLYLVVADRLTPADAIYVLEGMTPAREVEAAILYRRRLAPRVVLALGRDPAPIARRLAREPVPQERAARVLARLGVPGRAIVRLTREVENTEQELAVDFEFARAGGFRRVIFVTSPPHTRRVRTIWDARYQARLPALVYPTSFEDWDPSRWWRSRRWLEESLHELVGIAHFKIGGPLPTFDRGQAAKPAR